MSEPYIPFAGTGDGAGIADSVGSADGSGAAAIPAFLGGTGSGDAGGEQFDPAIHVGTDKRNADGRFTRKRGRRGNNSAGSRNKKVENEAGVEALTRALAIVHLGLSVATKTPELALEDQEANTLAIATKNVLVEFDIRPDPKIEAVFGLIVAAGTVYGPKVYFIRERWKKEAKEAEQDA